MRRYWMPQYGVPVNVSVLSPNTRMTGTSGRPADAGHIHHLPIGLDSKTSITTITNTTTETVLLTGTIDGSLLQAGNSLLINSFGTIQKNSNGSVDGTLRWKVGGTTIQALTITAPANSTGAWHILAQLNFLTVGANGTAGAGIYFGSDMSTNYGNATFYGAPTGTTPTTVNTTSSTLAIEFTFQWASASTNFIFSQSVGALRFIRTI